jgi:hypothetical protein
VVNLHPALIAARADAEERYPVAVRPVHVRLDLEDERREPLVVRLDQPLVALARGGQRHHLDEGVKQLGKTEVGDRAPEEHGRHRAARELVLIERVAGGVDELDVRAELR